MKWMRKGPYKPIATYGVIGNKRTAALVGPDGGIDWCCVPRFDGASVFAAILDDRRGGRFRIQLATAYTSTRRYLPLTSILVTTFHAHDGSGVVDVSDFMPVADAPEAVGRGAIYRRIRGVRGDVPVAIEFAPRFDYARTPTELVPSGDGLAANGGAETVSLVTSEPLDWRIDEDTATATQRVGINDVLWLVLRYDAGGAIPGMPPDPQRDLNETAAYWNRWAAGIQYNGLYRNEVERSALALKLLFYEPTGAIVAAPTTSLPERIGGDRNWDYRYCWLRDAAFTLSALDTVGLHEEAGRFARYLEWVARKSGNPLQALYGIGGETDIPESELPHLEGYRGSAPVRIGNQASRQLQLDVYGELLQVAFALHRRGTLEDGFRRLIVELVDWVADNWTRPDSGIWEVRTEPRHHVFSKVMCWVALDRAVRIAESQPGLDADVDRWREERQRIHDQVLSRGWNDRKRTFVQAYDDDAVDAANLLIPVVGFLPGDDDRVTGTIAATLRELTRDGMIYRYTNEDGVGGAEGIFSICTFWLADALILSGDIDHGERVFRRMIRRANALGLYSEEIDPSTGDFLGNFPQAFTHIALINTAQMLEQAHEGPLRSP